MADKSPIKANRKKPEKSLKEKRAAKKLKQAGGMSSAVAELRPSKLGR